MPPPPPTLSTLPYDILRIIASHLPSAASIASFAATSNTLRSFVALEGWRVFVQTRFPSFHAEIVRESRSRRAVETTDWRTWAQQQTLISRNWQRRGFIASPLSPEIAVHVPTGPRGGGGARGRAGTTRRAWTPGGANRGRQTMRYLPVLDAHESVWSTAESVVCIGAGPDLVLRKREGGRKAVWWGFESRDDRAGRGDITALQLLRPHEREAYRRGEVAIVGRANGKLEMVAMRTDGEPGRVAPFEVLARYETGGLGVKSAALLHRGGGAAGAAGEMVVGAVLGNSTVALYRVHGPGAVSSPPSPAVAQAPVSEIVLADGAIPWMTAFLSPSRMVLGATSSTPLTVFAVSSQEGIRSVPLRTFSAMECAGVKTMGVYATAPLPTSIGSAESAGDVFLGGWYDGVSRYVLFVLFVLFCLARTVLSPADAPPPPDSMTCGPPRSSWRHTQTP